MIRLLGVVLILIGTFLIGFQVTDTNKWMNTFILFVGVFFTIQGARMLLNEDGERELRD